MSIKQQLKAGLVILLMNGCGSSAAPTDGEPYAILTGSIHTALVDIASPVRAAVVWAKEPSSAGVSVSQERAVTGNFPAAFSLPLTTLPPLEAMQLADPSGVDTSSKYALGTLVVYEDTNGNGRLDLVALDQPPVDRILGTLPDELFFYIEGTPPPPAAFNGLALTPGFNLVALPQWTPDPQTACEPGCPEKQSRDWALVSLTAPLSLDLTGSPTLASFLCQEDPGHGGLSAAQPSLPPAGATVTCSADGTAYEYASCQVPSTPCAIQSCTSGWGTRTLDSVPAGWPCP